MSKVLLVDDEAVRLETIRQALARGGFETVTAADGNAGLRAFLNELPDLVLVGPFAAAADEAFCRWVRDTRPGVATPIVLYGESLSGAALKLALQQSRCNAYVEVPATDEHLIEVCRNTLGQAAGHDSTAAPGPVFDAQDAEDIDSHLDSMFETGTPPPAQPRQWDAEPEVSFETDRAAPSTAASGAAEFDPDRDLIGFDPNEVAFEGEGEIQPTAHPESAAETRSFVPRPIDRAGADAAASRVPPPVAAEVAVPASEPYTPGLPGLEDDALGSVDFALEDPPEASESLPRAKAVTGGLPPAAARRGGPSKALLYGAGAFIALVGAAGLFLMLRPATDGDPSVRTAAMTPATAPTSQAARPVPPPAASEMIPPQEPEVASAEDSSHTAAADTPPPAGVATTVDESRVQPAGATPIAPTAIDPAPVEAPVETAPAPPSSAEPPAATVVVTRTTPPPRPATPATTTPAKEPQPTPKPHQETIFVPSSTVLDAATAGPGFTPPRVIDRADPVYGPGSVPRGGESVTLRVLVNEWGKVVRVDIEKGRAGSPLVDAAVNAALATRYRPARDQGNEVRAWTTETFRFD